MCRYVCEYANAFICALAFKSWLRVYKITLIRYNDLLTVHTRVYGKRTLRKKMRFTMTKFAQQGNTVHAVVIAIVVIVVVCCYFWRRNSDRDMVEQNNLVQINLKSLELVFSARIGGGSLQLYRTYKHVPVTWLCTAWQPNHHTCGSIGVRRALLVHFDCLHSIFSHVWRIFIPSNWSFRLAFVQRVLFYLNCFLCR